MHAVRLKLGAASVANATMSIVEDSNTNNLPQGLLDSQGLDFNRTDGQMLTHILNNAPKLLERLQNGLSRLPFELVWTSHSQWPLIPGRVHQKIRISVLDASFNPPTLAHLALANSRRPKYTGDAGEVDYDAKLLLLSVKNADKSLKPGDASYLQRLQMMGLLAQDVSSGCSAELQGGNTAIGITDEPTFVGKSKIIKEYLNSNLPALFKGASPPPPLATQLSFILGMDTLERLLSPKYYTPPPDRPDLTHEQMMLDVLSHMLSPPLDGDDSLIVCARRVTVPSDLTQRSKDKKELDKAFAIASRMGWMRLQPGSSETEIEEGSQSNSADKRVWMGDERIVLIDIGDNESRCSSTAVRNARGSGSGGPWRDWVTKRVADYILKEGLYLG